ncbi:hypothetical protein EJB05_20779, partial [Eragrostis curvula]
SEKDWRIKSLTDTILRETQVGISLTKTYRAKRYAVQKIGGDYYEQYCRIQDYAHTLLHVNPRSSVVVKCFVDPARTINPRFERMYVSFGAQVKGFLAGCRPFIGLDGIHVKLPNGGQILTAQGKDANNNLFPIAFALVEAEISNRGHGFWSCWYDPLAMESIVGLKDGVKIVLPQAEHRYCLRHFYANFSAAGFKGPLLKQLMDRAAYAYKEYDFQQAMDKIKKVNAKAWKWLCDIDSKHWSKHKFSPNAKTDLVVNNISESYNAWILEAREEPICTMVEHIRTKLMESSSIKRDGAENDTWAIAPNYKKRLELEKKNASYCRVVCAGRGIWQVTCGDSQYVVDLNNRMCGCYKWDVTGVPCLHLLMRG